MQRITDLRIEETSVLYFIAMVTYMWSSFTASSVCSMHSFWNGSSDCFFSSWAFDKQSCTSSFLCSEDYLVCTVQSKFCRFLSAKQLSKGIKWWYFIFHFQNSFTWLFLSPHLTSPLLCSLPPLPYLVKGKIKDKFSWFWFCFPIDTKCFSNDPN